MSVNGDPRWPSAASLLTASATTARSHLSLVGIHTFESSLTPRSATSTPVAVRAALARYSTYSYDDDLDLADHIDIVDHGDVHNPDGPGGAERVRDAVTHIDVGDGPLAILGGDNAATYLAMSALAGNQIERWGLITFDAHLDLREGESNGSPIRQLLEAGLDGHHVVQVGLADFSNSAHYAARARAAGMTAISRAQLRTRPIADVVDEALSIAGSGGRPVYVDIDLDVVDRAAVPGCPAATPGGMSPDELRQAGRLLARDPRVRAVDLTEIDVERDSDDQRTVRLAALVLLEICAGLLRRPL